MRERVDCCIFFIWLHMQYRQTNQYFKSFTATEINKASNTKLFYYFYTFLLFIVLCTPTMTLKLLDKKKYFERISKLFIQLGN